MPRNLMNLCFLSIKSSSSPKKPTREIHGRALIKNFNSLYDPAPASNRSRSAAASDHFATALASQRFFFSSPGTSNSIISSSSPASTGPSKPRGSIYQESPDSCGCSIAVPSYSPDPLTDFRRSMQEMVDARGIHDAGKDWPELQELLMRYLSLNPKSTHKFIVGAFSDLLISLMSDDDGKRT